MKTLLQLFLMLIILHQLGKAQNLLQCGPVTLNTKANSKALEYSSNHIRQIFASPITIRVYFHILQCTDGSFRATSQDSIATEFNHLVAGYSADNICFINGGFDYINNTKLDTNFTAGIDPPSLFDPYRVSGCINIFYVVKIKGTNSSCPGGCGFGGITLGTLPTTFCLVAQSNINDNANTVAHEVGHCFGLLHTFNDGYGYERIDRLNGTTSADKVTDTNADPYDYPTPCNTSTGCGYTGTCTDPDGKSNFAPPYDNIMSYWLVKCNTQGSFTQGQFSRLEGFLNTDPSLLNCISPNNVIEGPINITNTRRIVTANNNVTTNGAVIISGNSLVTYGGAKVVIENGFKATPSNGGKIIIRSKKCN